MTEGLDAVSIWEDEDSASITYNGEGRVLVTQTNGRVTVKIDSDLYKQSDLPADPNNWAGIVTTEEDHHYPEQGVGVVSTLKQSRGRERLKIEL